MNRIAWMSGCILLLCGCAYKNEPAPELVDTYPDTMIRLAPPTVVKSSRKKARKISDTPADWLVDPSIERKWKAIVVHHSATDNGSRAIFDNTHRHENGWDGVGYDFVIGNGTDSGDGQVEVTFRWRRQLTGAHCKTPGNWANENAVGICLVGNFNEARPSAAQMRSALKLVCFLQERYGIGRDDVYGHNAAPGARGTECPGRNFPMSRFKSMIRR